MSDKVNLYPKSSCPECKKEYPATQGIKSNLAVQGCSPSPYFDCYDRVSLQDSIQPNPNTGLILMNNYYNTKLAPFFDAIDPKCRSCNQPSTEPNWISLDPRLYDATRAEYLPLDRPPIDGDVKLKNIPNIRGYKTGFSSYENLTDGQIGYYIDKSIAPAFFTPVYGEPAIMSSVLYRDPMSSMKPEYNRTPILNTQNPITECRDNYPYCLSFLQDTQSQREDIMALQQRKNNQSKWSARWDVN